MTAHACRRTALTLAFALGSLGVAPEPIGHADTKLAPLVYASATCAPASKPGRIRCRAVIELPLDRASASTLSWGELRVVQTDDGLAPLRGRLGPLDAETRDDGRIAWTFSVAAASIGERSMTLALATTVEPRDGSGATPLVRTIVVAVRVAP